MAGMLLYAIISYLALWAISWWAAIRRGWGAAESAHDPSSGWFYLRRFLLIGAALAGVTAGGGPAAYGWALSPWLPAILALGLLLGSANRGGFAPTTPLALLLALFHTFAVELYFRGYLFHQLAPTVGWAALPLSALLYGLYYLTVHTVWAGGRRGRFAGVILFTLLGMLFAGVYAATGSFLAPWLCHFGAVLRLNLLPARRRQVQS